MKINTTFLALVMISMVGCAHARSGDEQPSADLAGFIDPTAPVSSSPVCVDFPCVPADSPDMVQFAEDMAQPVALPDMAMATVDMDVAVDMSDPMETDTVDMGLACHLVHGQKRCYAPPRCNEEHGNCHHNKDE